MISSTTTSNVSSGFPTNDDDEDMELLPLVMLLWAKKIFIGWLVLSGFLIGTLYALNKISIYQADALVQLETDKGSIALSENISDLMSSDSEAITEIEIIKSRMVLGKTVSDLKLDIISAPRSQTLLNNLTQLTGLQIPDWEWLSVFGRRDEKIQVESLDVENEFLGKTLVIKTISKDRYQVEAADGSVLEGVIGDSLVHPDDLYKLKISNIIARPGVEFLVQKVSALSAVTRLKKSLTVTEKGRGSNLIVLTVKDPDPVKARNILDRVLGVYISQNVNRGSEEAQKSIEFLEKQLPLVRDELSVAENELNSYRLKHESINLDLESASVLDRMVGLDTQIRELTLEETELSRLYTTAHPRYVSLTNKKAMLIAEKESLSSIVQSFPETQQEILKRTRDLEVNQHVYMQLLNKKQELDVLKASAVGSVRLIDSAIAHPDAISPNRGLIAVVYSLVALWLGCGVVLLRFFLERNVDSPDDISRLGLAVYATVPRAKMQEVNGGMGDCVLSRDNPTELAVEALRSLRTSLHFGLLDQGKGVVSITGPAPGVGKSFVASNLAYLVAESGSRVLVVDADMRRGTLADIFNIEKNSEGLSELLAGTIKLEQAIKPVDLKTATTNFSNANAQKKVRSLEPELESVFEGIDLLDTEHEPKKSSAGQLAVIPRGKTPPNPAELLMQDRLPNLLREVSQSFDIVIVDTPPILAVTDGMIVGRYTDMNLMVVRHNQTGLREMEAAVKVFTSSSVELSGAILNDYDQKNGRFGQYGYEYGYQYQYESVD